MNTPALALALACALAAMPVRAAEIFISPVRADLRAGALNETITVTNRGSTRLRVAVKLMEWTQDAQGKDVYQDTGDIVYFPRQMDIEPDAKRVIRLGAKAAPAGAERAYRLFIEEQPEPGSEARAQVSVFFRFGVPVFLTPIQPRPQHEILEPALENGRLSLVLRNTGNQHVRVNRVKVSDDAGFHRDIPGWYSLAGTQRTYSLELPREVCRKAKTLSVAVEGEGIRAERKLNVDPARCI